MITSAVFELQADKDVNSPELLREILLEMCIKYGVRLMSVNGEQINVPAEG